MDTQLDMRYGMNNLYVHPMYIYRQLQTRYRTAMESIDPLTIYEWCAYAEHQLLVDVDKLKRGTVSLGFKVNGVNVVVDRRVIVPLFVKRIGKVLDENMELISYRDYTYNGTYIHFNTDDYNGKQVYADVYMLEYDPEEMIPLIRTEHVDAVMKYCVYNLFLDDITMQRIPQAQAQRMYDEYIIAMADAASKNWSMTEDEYVDIAHIVLDLGYDTDKIIK